MVFLLILHALWFIAPAYAANGFPPLMRGRVPLDFGRTWRKKRLLGTSKTAEGTLGGIIVGIAIGSLQVVYQDQLAYLGLGLPHMTFTLVAVLSVGTMAGDLLGSFAKRQMNIKPGDTAPGLDQLGFVLAALALASFVSALDPVIVAILVIVTPPIHWFTNVLGYWLHFKKEPW